MEINFQELMAKKSDEDLQVYFTNPEKYTPEALEAATNELKARGGTLSETEIRALDKIIIQKRLEDNQDIPLYSDRWKKNVVTDDEAPLYYSQRAIWVFTIIFCALAGTLLFTANLRKSKKKEWSLVLVFGIAYTVLSIWLINLIKANSHSITGLAYLFNVPCGLVLNNVLWKRLIGADIKYRARAIWRPLIIWIIVVVFFVVIQVYA